MMALDGLLAPNGIAVVGASPKPGHPSRRVLKQLRRFGFAGLLAAVNPGYPEIDGVACYPTLADVPGHVDLVLVFVPAAGVSDVIRQAGALGIGSAVVFSSGFAEVGTAGAELQADLRATAESAGVRLVGPNCQGVVNFSAAVVATFTGAVTAKDMAPAAPFAYLGQSGAVGGSFFDLARERGVVPTTWVSTGNQADLDVADVGQALLGREQYALICAYLEQVPPGDAWTSMIEAATQTGTRVAVLRSGRSPAGRRAAASHTGAMVGSDAAFGLVNQRFGVIEVDDIDELVDLAVAWPTSAGGRRLGVVTTSGGAGCLIVDAAEEAGLPVPQLDEATQEALGRLVPAFGATANPVDVTAQLFTNGGRDFAAICRLVAEAECVDQLVIVLTMVVDRAADELAGSMVELLSDLPVPVSLVYLASHDRTAAARNALGRAGVPVFDTGASAVRAIERLTRTPPNDVVRLGTPGQQLAEGVSGVLTEAAGAPLLDRFGVPHPEAFLVHDETEAAKAATEIGAPVVLKVQSPQLLHKSEHGGVCVNVQPEDAGAVFRAMCETVRVSQPGIEIDGVLVQRMADAGTELLVGVLREAPDYPPVLTVGIGGVTTEIYSDIVTALAPVTSNEALDLLRQLRGWPLLCGYRGSAPADLTAAAESIAAISRLAVAFGDDLAELEINPLIVHAAGSGATAADFLYRPRAATPSE